MPFTHYPKNTENLIAAVVWPAPPDKPHPHLPLPLLSEVNRATGPLEPGKTIRVFHEAQNFTRFYGSITSDQSLEIACSFSNDEVYLGEASLRGYVNEADGSIIEPGTHVNDSNIHLLNYDAEALRQTFDPAKPKASNGSKFFVTIFGRWICFELTNKGTAPTQFVRAYLRGSVF